MGDFRIRPQSRVNPETRRGAQRRARLGDLDMDPAVRSGSKQRLTVSTRGRESFLFQERLT